MTAQSNWWTVLVVQDILTSEGITEGVHYPVHTSQDLVCALREGMRQKREGERVVIRYCGKDYPIEMYEDRIAGEL